MTEPAKNQAPEASETPQETPAQPQSSTPDRSAGLEAELAEAKDKMLRALADADNTRKRAERMQIDTTKYAVAGFARDLLDVADNLRRAIDSIKPEQRETDELAKTILEGIEATERAMIATFERNGIRKLTPTGGAFDPNVHEVMFETEVPGKKGGEIIQLIESGYMIHDRLLRPARVGVAKDAGGGKIHHVDETA